MRLSIAQRLLLVVCVLSLLLGATGAVLMRHIAETRYDDEMKMTKKTVNVALLDFSHVFERILLRIDAEKAKNSEKSDEDIAAWTRDEQAAVRDNAARSYALIHDFVTRYPEQTALVEHYRDFEARLKVMASRSEPLNYAVLNTFESDIIAASGPATLSTDYEYMYMLGMIMLGLGILAPLLVYSMVRGLLTVPLRRLSDRLYGLTNQDYDSEVPYAERHDELGQMAFSIDVLRLTYRHASDIDAERLKEAQDRASRQRMLDALIEEFRERTANVIDAVSLASGQLSSSSERILSSVDAAQRHASTIDETVGKSAVDVREACHHADLAYAAMSTIAQSSNAAQKTSADADDDVDAALSTVTELANATDRITGVTHLIRKITERINLLALNAGIESARAGEAGKGFVVVAQEVKVLAAQTKKATEEIIDNIALLQEKSGAANQALGNVKQRVSKIREGNEQEHTVVETQRRTVNDLTYNMKGANSAMASIQKSIGTVRESIESVQAVSRNVADTGRSLNVNANILSQEVRKFLGDINKAS